MEINNDVKDPYNSKRRFDNWIKKKEINGVNKNNSDLIFQFIQDLSLGMNTKGKKGVRSPKRLNTLRDRLSFIFRELEKREIKDIKKATMADLHKFFNDMRTGIIKNRFGTAYKSTGDYVKCFKTFWHWLQITNMNAKTNQSKFNDITSNLDTRGEKPKFVYFTEEDCKRIINRASYDLKPILSLQWDSGMRVTEGLNIKVSDFSKDFKELSIRPETSKTFGRKIKLMFCPEQIKDYISKLKLNPDDFLFQVSPMMINKELRKIGKEILMPEQVKYKNLSLYDFRHSSACFWLPRYKSESALKYRFGWKKSDMIHYYTEFLGMSDTIKQEDIYIDVTKTELEREIESIKKENEKEIESLKEQVELNSKMGEFVLSIIKNSNPKEIANIKKRLEEFDKLPEELKRKSSLSFI